MSFYLSISQPLFASAYNVTGETCSYLLIDYHCPPAASPEVKMQVIIVKVPKVIIMPGKSRVNM